MIQKSAHRIFMLIVVTFAGIVLASNNSQRTTNDPDNLPHFVEILTETNLECPDRSRTAIWLDYDRDSHTDLFVCVGHNQRNLLFRNLGDGTFKEIGLSCGLHDSLYTYYAYWVDINNDGFLDLFTHNYQQDIIYLNSNNLNFTDISKQVNFRNGSQAVWADYDCDGWLDLYICRTDEFPRQAFSPANSLYRNLGDGSFDDVSTMAGVDGNEDSGSANWVDLDADGYLDLLVCNVNNQHHRFYHNNGDGTFSDIFYKTMLGDHDETSFFADYDNDGYYDVLLTDRNVVLLYRNTGRSSFTEQTQVAALKLPESNKIDAMWLDFDNDGYMDIHFQCELWDSDSSKFILYRNQGNGTFHEISQFLNVRNCLKNQGFVWGDYDNDGDLDIYLLNSGRDAFYRNNANDNHWIKIELEGRSSNRDGIGARITIKSGSLVQYRYAGIGQGYKSTSMSTLLFGLGKNRHIDQIIVEWPSGMKQDTTNLRTERIIKFIEPSSALFTDVTKPFGLYREIYKSLAGAFIDVNDDDLQDIVVANHECNLSLFVNAGSGRFLNLAKQYEVDVTGYSSGLGVGDFNNDGFDDLFIVSAVYSPNFLFINDHGERFKNISLAAGISGSSLTSEDLVLGDFNNDGDLDIYVGNDGPNKMYYNNGDLTFTDATSSSGTGDTLISRCTAADFDNDGDLDIYVANNRGGYNESKIGDGWPNRLFRNNGNGIFTDIAALAGVDDAGNSKGCCFGDYDNDGHLDLYVGNDGGSNRLYRNNGDDTFSDRTQIAGVTEPIGTHGVTFADFNNDGWLDIYAAGGSYIPERHDYCMTKDHPDMLYLNRHDGTFEKVSGETCIDQNLALTNSLACGDIDLDGDLDIFLPNSIYKGTDKSRNKLLRNKTADKNWIQFKLIGRISNRSAVGARIKVCSADLVQIREISGGDGGGSQNSLVAAFGLGKHSQIDKVTIHWPCGIDQEMNDVPINSRVTVNEPYQFGSLQLSARLFTVLRIIILMISGMLLIAGIVGYAIIPLVSFWKDRLKRYRADRRDNTSTFKILPESNILKIRINMIPFRGEMLLSYSVTPPKQQSDTSTIPNLYHASGTPYAIKALKSQRLEQEIVQLWKIYSSYLRTGESRSVKSIDLMKKIGTQIYRYFGLAGLLDQLFEDNSSEDLHINLMLNDHSIVWQWAYSEQKDQFLCEKYPLSLTYEPIQKDDALGDSANSKFRGNSISTNYECAVLFYGDWKGHSRELKKVPEEIDCIERILHKRQIKTYRVYQNTDEFVDTINQINDRHENLRLIHYSGHIDKDTLAPGENDFLPLNYLRQSYGMEFPSRPMIFFNGCHAGYDLDPHQKHPDLSNEVLNCGAMACIITRFQIPELSAKNFAILFYHHFINKGKTAGQALKFTRHDMTRTNSPESINPDYDITRYLYDLYGEPTIYFHAKD